MVNLKKYKLVSKNTRPKIIKQNKNQPVTPILQPKKSNFELWKIRNVKDLSYDKIKSIAKDLRNQGKLRDKDFKKFVKEVKRKVESNRIKNFEKNFNKFIKKNQIKDEIAKNAKGHIFENFSPRKWSSYKEARNLMNSLSKNFNVKKAEILTANKNKNLSISSINNIKDFIDTIYDDRSEFYHNNIDLIKKYNSARKNKNDKLIDKLGSKLSDKWNEYQNEKIDDYLP